MTPPDETTVTDGRPIEPEHPTTTDHRGSARYTVGEAGNLMRRVAGCAAGDGTGDWYCWCWPC